jgi:hypothetical protein
MNRPTGMADRWQAKIARPIVMRDGTKLKTLAKAGAFILALPEAFQQHNSWLKASETPHTCRGPRRQH